MQVEGQAAIVSGGGSGLGRATAQALAAAGVKVAIFDINEAAASETARETGGLAIGADVTDAESVKAAFAAGIFATRMVEGLPQNVRDSRAASSPFPNRLGRPEEYAALMLHLCRNTMINGEVIRLDGALRMAPR